MAFNYSAIVDAIVFATPAFEDAGGGLWVFCSSAGHGRLWFNLDIKSLFMFNCY